MIGPTSILKHAYFDSMNWPEAISELDATYPYLGRLYVSDSSESVRAELPPILRVSTAIAVRMMTKLTDVRRAAIVFPRAGDAARWVAAGAALAAVRADFSAGRPALPPLRLKDRLLVDGRYVVEYAGEDVAQDGTPLLRLRMEGTGTFLSIPACQRMRLQHTSSRRPLSRRPPPRIKPDPLDAILDIDARGNRSLWNSSVLLVSPITRARSWALGRYASLAPSGISGRSTRLVDLFPWGGIARTSGEAELWGPGQVMSAAVCAVASDLFAAEDYLTGGGAGVRIVVLDGAHSFVKDLQLLDEILGADLPALALLDACDIEAMSFLADRDFQFWTWSKSDLASDQLLAPASRRGAASGPFGDLYRTLRNSCNLSIFDVFCPSDDLDEAARLLVDIDRETRLGADQTGALVGSLYGALLALARQVRPVGADGRTTYITRRLDEAEQELRQNRVWLSAEAYSKGQSVLAALRRAESARSPKVDALEVIIRQEMAHCSGLVGVVVGNDAEAGPAIEYWKKRLGTLDNVLIADPSGFDEHSDCDALVVCGWLSARKMRRLVSLYAAPRVHVLVHRFEREWLRTSQARWQREASIARTKDRAGLLGIREDELVTERVDAVDARPVPRAAEAFDISDFELRLRSYRRQALAARAQTGEERIEAQFLDLTGGYYAFLSVNYHVPVVTDHIRQGAGGEIPQKTVTEIKVGDYLLFRESAEGNLIRTLADRGLAASGRKHMRATASLWRKALHQLYERLGANTPTLVRELRRAGCKRTPTTIRGWVHDEDTIGPRSDEDLEIIAAIADDGELGRRLAEVRQAITEVRGAHLQASSFLIRKLLEAAPEQLAEQSGAVLTIELEGIGRAVVVGVEEVAADILLVGQTRANRLLREADDGTDGPSTSLD